MTDHAPRASFIRWLGARGDPTWGVDPAHFDAAAVAASLRGIGRLFGAEGSYFPLSFAGWEHVPDAPTMFVMNHSGGTTIPDVWGFLAGWYERFTPARPLYVMGHEMLFATDATSRYLAARGILRASPRHCVRVLREARRDVLIAPGGDRDVWRPWSRRYEVEFAGRRGYARTALACGVPIVPVAHVGAHHTLYVLTDGRAIARALGFQRVFRAEVFPVHLSLPWGLAVGPWPHLPLPVRMRYRLGAPVGAAAAEPAVPDDDAVRATDEAVRGAIQRMLDAFRAEDEAR
jgi:1-acyl-sn-glycerol-3-phosphate acyltransferase